MSLSTSCYKMTTGSVAPIAGRYTHFLHTERKRAQRHTAATSLTTYFCQYHLSFRERVNCEQRKSCDGTGPHLCARVCQRMNECLPILLSYTQLGWTDVFPHEMCVADMVMCELMSHGHTLRSASRRLISRTRSALPATVAVIHSKSSFQSLSQSADQ